MKTRVILSLVLCFFVLGEAEAFNSGTERSVDLISFCYQTTPSNYYCNIENDSMKIRDLVILVKYGQGLIVFNSFFEYLKFFKSSERKAFLSEIVALTDNWHLDDSYIDTAIEKSELNITSPACEILREGVDKQQLQRIAALPENELEASFKLLLTLFSLGYQREFGKNMNDSDKFWYWDYSDEQNIFKLLKLNDADSVDIDLVMKH